MSGLRAMALGGAVWLVLTGGALAQRDIVTYTDAESAGTAYKIQGEYVGEIDSDGARWGAHVIALGDGKFRAVGYQDGLPGDGWTPDKEKHELDGKLEGEKATFATETFKVEVDGSTMRIVDGNGTLLGELKKVNRKSPTLGAKPPAGAVVLFDGSNVDAWENGRLVGEGNEEKLLGATNCVSKQKFQDHQLHVEFRTPFMPKAGGQGRGNSGVYVHHRYEVQVLDSFGLKGESNECGGIYGQTAPKLNMCFPPLTWQTYDIDFKAARYDASGKKTQNARITVRHNGELIYEDLELPRDTPGGISESAEPGGLFFQNHGNPVVFRNVWVVPK